MGWLDWFSRKTDRPRFLFSFQKPGDPVSWDRTYDNFSKEGYQKNVIVFRCISMVATACAGIPWVMYKVKGRKRLEEIEDHPLLDLFDRPNPYQSGEAFREARVAYREISGNSYMLAVSPNSSFREPPRELWMLNPQKVKIIPGAKSLPQAFRYGDAQNYIDYPVNPLTGEGNVLHGRNFHPVDPWYGMSPLEAAAFSVDQHNFAGKWNAALLQNSAQPSGALVMEVTDKNPSGTLGETEFTKLKEDLDHRFSGPAFAGRPMLLQGGLKWQQMSLSPKDMDWVNSKSTSARDIAFAFGVPPMLVGIPGDNTYANYSEARIAFYEEKILPTMDVDQADLNRFLVPRFGGDLVLGYDKDEIEALGPKRDQVWARVQSATWLTVNEKRHATGYEELGDGQDGNDGGGDAILVPSSTTTLEAIAKDAEAPSEEPGADDPSDDLLENEDEREGGEDANATEENPSKAFKVFNVRTNAAKTREWKRQNRLRKKFISRMNSQVSALFKVEGDQVAHAISGLGEHAAMIAATHTISKHMKSWHPVLIRNIRQTATAFGHDILSQAKAHKSLRKTGEDDRETRFEAFLKHWIENHVGERIQDLEETTRKKVIDAIREAYAETIAEGEGAVSLADKIEEIYDEFSKGRAGTIARTEIGTASNYASLQAAKASGLQLNKEWVARDSGAESRPTHQEVNGTILPMDEKFDVGDYEMVGPGDPGAGPEEICNCYCILIYSTDKNAGSGSADEGDIQDE